MMKFNLKRSPLFCLTFVVLACLMVIGVNPSFQPAAEQSPVGRDAEKTLELVFTLMKKELPYLDATVLSENLVVDAYEGPFKGKLAHPLVAIYPKEGTFWVDYPVGIVQREWVSRDHTKAVTTGIISTLHRKIEMPTGITINEMIQFDAPINPGNSGGPLMNIDGDLIGIIVCMRDGAQGIGFAINSDAIAMMCTKHLPSANK